MAKKKPEVLKNIVTEEIFPHRTEKSKKVSKFLAEMFRLALLQNYDADNLVYKKLNKNGFNWIAFTNFIHGSNFNMHDVKKFLPQISIFTEMPMQK